MKMNILNSVFKKSKNLKTFILIVSSFMLLLSVSSFNAQPDNPDAIVGLWKTGEGTAMVRIYKNGDKYQGKVVWLKEPTDPETGKPKVDKKHPDESVRSRPILGLVNVWGFVYKGDNIWNKGKIYDPKNGNTYSCNIKLESANKMEVRGFVGVSLIGRTDIWTRQASE